MLLNLFDNTKVSLIWNHLSSQHSWQKKCSLIYQNWVGCDLAEGVVLQIRLCITNVYPLSFYLVIPRFSIKPHAYLSPKSGCKFRIKINDLVTKTEVMRYFFLIITISSTCGDCCLLNNTFTHNAAVIGDTVLQFLYTNNALWTYRVERRPLQMSTGSYAWFLCWTRSSVRILGAFHNHCLPESFAISQHLVNMCDC